VAAAAGTIKHQNRAMAIGAPRNHDFPACHPLNAGMAKTEIARFFHGFVRLTNPITPVPAGIYRMVIAAAVVDGSTM
jgi:hypothetical protein